MISIISKLNKNLGINLENQDYKDMLYDITNTYKNLCCYRECPSLVALMTDMICYSTNFDLY